MSDRGPVVLGIARNAIAQALGRACRIDGNDVAWLNENGSSFVTLRRNGDLRGCIGSLETTRRLAEDIAKNAVAAALHDRRFPPVEASELDALEVEVSLLTPPELLPCTDEADALRMLRPGVDGVVIEFGQHRATFLPQVWESLPEAPLFLRELKRKAGLPADFWHPGIRVSRYGVEKHCEQRVAHE